ncbi:hypothetical protein MtrunA17_Chr8g0336771 [Medicago truncatula]|uniref:Uncharacterized protein n=1 Tax=Medicago truncatula TaxID=3880 RepID=A0A396GBQ5_MEDTR|nr:hypothetical protein MtrunA17_Chr8g0336771 [Medicago truncatula]
MSYVSRVQSEIIKFGLALNHVADYKLHVTLIATCIASMTPCCRPTFPKI